MQNRQTCNVIIFAGHSWMEIPAFVLRCHLWHVVEFSAGISFYEWVVIAPPRQAMVSQPSLFVRSTVHFGVPIAHNMD